MRVVAGVLAGLLIGSVGAWAAPRYFISVWEFRSSSPSIRDAYVAGISDTFDAISRWGEGYLVMVISSNCALTFTEP